MAWKYGFFNSLNGDRTYNAQDMSEMFLGLISDGVYSSIGNQLAVEPNSGMTVQINTGRGYFNGHWVKNDSEYLQAIEGSDVLLKRYCAVCVRVDDSDEVRSATLNFKYSEFATNPIRPEMERSELVNEFCLAYILINAGATEITAADIEDTRGDNNLCGWVHGLIEQIDTTTLWNQFKAEWEQFMESKESDSAAWFAQQQADFLAWYNNLQTNLEGDVAATLTSKVQTLEGEMDNVKTELSNKLLAASGVLRASGWAAQSDGTYQQTITLAGVTVTNYVIEGPATDVKAAYLEAECEAIAQGANSLTYKCASVPSADIPIEVMIANI